MKSTVYFGEYGCKGPGARQEERSGWVKQLTDDEAKEYTLSNILAGNDCWQPNNINGGI